MTDRQDEEWGAALDPTEVAALHEALGKPTTAQVKSAIEEVERQIALEDLLILMVEAVQETVRAFFDFVLQLDSTFAPSHRDRQDQEEEPKQ